MPRKYQIATAFIGSVITYRLITHPLRRKYVETARALINIGRENDSLHAQMEYLVDVINRHDVELDEFDLIVLTHVSEIEA